MTELPRDIICFSLSRWDQAISSPAWSIAKELSKNHRVFFIDHPYTLKDVVREFTSSQVQRRRKSWFGNSSVYCEPIAGNENLFVVVPPVVLPVNFLPNNFLYQILSRVNDSLMNRLLSQIIRYHQVRNYIFINFFDPFYLRNIHVDLKPTIYVYQSMDDISEVRYTARHGVRLEEELIKRADLTICTSKKLFDMHQSKGNVALLQNGVDLELFQTAFRKEHQIPADIKHLRGPIIIFTGSIDYRMDFELVQRTARAHANKTFLFVGPVNTTEHEQFFKQDANIVFVGAKNIDQLPAYLQHCDCAIIPYKKNKLTAAIYPLKINEYLASGIPVVTTDFSEDVVSFEPLVYLAGNSSSFVALIEDAVNDKDDAARKRRMEYAMQNSWEQRVDALEKMMLMVAQ